MPEFFPLWVVITRFLNIFFLLLLARSGLEVLSADPAESGMGMGRWREAPVPPPWLRSRRGGGSPTPGSGNSTTGDGRIPG